MLEIILLANFAMLVLIYRQLRKNTKDTDSYFAAIDLSLRQFFVNISNSKSEHARKRHDEVLKKLENISTHTNATAKILDNLYNPKSIEDEYYESEKNSKWLAKAKLASEKIQR